MPNLLKPPKTLTGPLPVQIAQASAYVLDELAAGLTLAASGFKTVHRYPPFYGENRDAAQPSVIVSLLNEERPPIWEQVSDWMDRNGPLANSDLCQIAGVDTLKASKVLKRWVEQGVLLRDDSAGKRHTVYRKPVPDGAVEAGSSLSLTLDNGPGQ